MDGFLAGSCRPFSPRGPRTRHPPPVSRVPSTLCSRASPVRRRGSHQRPPGPDPADQGGAGSEGKREAVGLGVPPETKVVSSAGLRGFGGCARHSASLRGFPGSCPSGRGRGPSGGALSATDRGPGRADLGPGRTASRAAGVRRATGKGSGWSCAEFNWQDAGGSP